MLMWHVLNSYFTVMTLILIDSLCVWKNLTMCRHSPFVVVNLRSACIHCSVKLSLFRAVVQPYVGVFRSVLLPGWRGCGGRRVYGCWVFVRVWKTAFGIMVWGVV
jgi:hypothetical protein